MSCVLLIALLVLAGCGPESGSGVGDQRDQWGDEPLGLPDLGSDALHLAVVDGSSALVLETRAGSLAAAATLSKNGEFARLEQGLPALGKVDVVGAEGRFIVVGIRCADAVQLATQVADDQQLCSVGPGEESTDRAEPVAFALDINGKVLWSAVGPLIDPSQFGGMTPTKTGALLQLNGAWYIVSEGSFTAVGVPEGDYDEFTPCALRDGRLAAFASKYASVDDDAGGGFRQALIDSGEGWTSVGEPLTVTEGDLVTTSCSTGGLVTRTELFVGSQPEAARLEDLSLESVVGVTADGLVLVDSRPRALINPRAGSVAIPLPEARYVALSWDGRAVAHISDDSVTIELRP